MRFRAVTQLPPLPEGEEGSAFGFEGDEEMHEQVESTPKKSVNLVKLEPTAYTNILMIQPHFK